MTLRPRNLVLMAAAVAAVSTHGLSAAQSVLQPPPQNVMTLSATATAEATTDLLSIVFSTTREGADAAQVQAQLKQALDAALAEARRVARPGQVEVQTGSFSMSPRYAAKGGINGWQGSAQMQVDGRDIAAISQLAGRIQTLSVVRVQHMLSREAREKLEAETTAQAITRFRARAAAQSQQFGFGSYTVREVQIGTDSPAGVVPVAAMRMRTASISADEPLPVEPGKATVTSTVSGSVQMLK